MAVQLLSRLEEVGDIFGPWLHFGGGAARNKEGEKSLNFYQTGLAGVDMRDRKTLCDEICGQVSSQL